MQKNPNPRGAKETKKPGTKRGTVIQTKKNARGVERPDVRARQREMEDRDREPRPGS